MNAFLQDFRYALRQVRRNPAFTAVAVVTLALGIGANTAIFSAVRGILLRPLPTPGLDRVLVVRQDLPDLALTSANLAPPEVEELGARTEVFESVAGFSTNQWNLTGAGEPVRVSAALTMGDFFGILGVKPHLGRLYTPEASTSGEHEVVVLSYAAWQQLTGGSPAIVGSTVELDGAAREVIGVLPPGFGYPRGAQVYKPFNYTPSWRNRRGTLNMTALVRLRPGVTREQAAARLAAESARWNEAYHAGAKTGTRLFAVPLVEYMAGPLRPILFVLTGAVALVLLLACANVASLQLVRASGRSREMAVRTAIGAGRGRIFRQCLIESLVLAVTGGVLGLALGRLALALLARWDPAQQQALEGVRLDGPVLAFALVLSVLAAVVSGVAPAVRATRVEPQVALRQAGAGTAADPARNRFLAASVVVQVALALVLLVGSGLMIRSLTGLIRTDPGFRPDGVMTAQVALPDSRYPDVERQAAFLDALVERLRGTPGIEAAAVGWPLPFSDQLRDSAPFTLPGRAARTGGPELHAEYRVVSADYFRTLGIPLLRGRTFGASERAGAPMAVLVDETFAQRFFPGEDPVGREIEHAMGPATIVGVVGSVHDAEIGAPGEPTTYYHHAQAQIPWMAIAVRTSLPSAPAAEAIRAAVREGDPQLPVYDVAAMEARIRHSLGGRRLAAAGLGAFAGVSLLLAVLGLYGLMRYSTRQRTREIGIRMALGARSRDVVRSVVRRGLVLVAAGLALGLGGALLLTRLIAGLLYGVRPTDPATILSVAALLLATGFAASWLAARRAARVDPIVALRAE